MENNKGKSMQFDQNNPVIKLCSEGMEMEGKAKPEEAKRLFELAWSKSKTDFDKFTSAHYVARQQKTIEDKLKWDEIALEHALKLNDENIKGSLPSLYLNIGKGYEDLKKKGKAIENYNLALKYSDALPNNDYGDMIRNGIRNGIARLQS